MSAPSQPPNYDFCIDVCGVDGGLDGGLGAIWGRLEDICSAIRTAADQSVFVDSVNRCLVARIPSFAGIGMTKGILLLHRWMLPLGTCGL